VLRPISVGISIILLILYVASLLFQLRTHAHLYGVEGEEEEAEEGEHGMSLKRAVLQLLGATVAVAILSEYLVHAIEGATKTFGFTETFVGVVVLATVGNAAEHSSAIMMALKDRMNLSYAIASESSKQIALFVAPVLVILSGFIGPPMSLEFSPFEVAAVGISVASATIISIDGRSNWLEGAMLLGVYLILGIAFFFTA
jgi:Ca2+:H+ antiporter